MMTLSAPLVIGIIISLVGIAIGLFPVLYALTVSHPSMGGLAAGLLIGTGTGGPIAGSGIVILLKKYHQIPTVLISFGILYLTLLFLSGIQITTTYLGYGVALLLAGLTIRYWTRDKRLLRSAL